MHQDGKQVSSRSKRLTTSVLIPTYDRPAHLASCLEALLKQTVPPDEIIIVDDGALKTIPKQAAFVSAGIEIIYRRKQSPGVTESRNLGAALASGDIVVLSEDDVEVFPDYIERLLEVYTQDTQHQIGGVGGVIDNERRTPTAGIELLVYLAFRLTGLREGRILRSGFASDYGRAPKRIHEVEEVDFLLGGVSSFRRRIFDEFNFSNRYRSRTGYGQGEDKEFSYRVSRRYRLVVQPRARLHHSFGSKQNYDRVVRGRAYVLSRYFFFKEQVKRHWWQWPLFFYALGGYTLYRAVIALVQPTKRIERERMRGLLQGWRGILSRARIESL